MSIWNKVKGFFGRVWNGIKKGASKIGSFITGTGSKIYNALKPAINMIPGASMVTSTIDRILPTVGSTLKSIGDG